MACELQNVASFYYWFNLEIKNNRSYYLPAVSFHTCVTENIPLIYKISNITLRQCTT